MSNVVLEKVSRNFGEFAAVSGVDLRVNEGEFVTLLGPSGCGKTTTLRMVAGLEQNSEGRISIGGELVSDAARGVFVPSERRRLGMVFQSYAIWPHMSVFDNVAYPLRVRRRPNAEVRDLVTRTLRLVEMERYAERPAPALSGGQQQRVAIARALVFEPKVLLLDEPLSNLDAKLRLQMGDEFRAIQRRLGMTTLYVTHDQSEAMALSDRVVVMDRGRIQQIGAPEEIYRYPANRTVAAFFGTPNLLDAEVETCARIDGRRVRLDVVGQGWRGPCEAAEEIRPGQAVTVMVRPEDARLAAAGASASERELKWSGRIAQTIFRGATRSIVVETDNGRLNVDAAAFLDYAIGDNVNVIVPQRAAWAVPREDAASSIAITAAGAEPHCFRWNLIGGGGKASAQR
jgi:iron(III) transport system ATP-binding protein